MPTIPILSSPYAFPITAKVFVIMTAVTSPFHTEGASLFKSLFIGPSKPGSALWFQKNPA